MMGQVPPAQPRPPQTPAIQDYRVSFNGRGGDLFWLHFKNGLLSQLTLGIYSAWAITDVRKWYANSTEFAGARFEFRGTGGELFVALLKAGLFVVAVFVAAAFASNLWEPLGKLLPTLVFLPLTPLIIYGSRSYRLSRTWWCGYQFGMRPDARTAFAGLFLKGLALTVLTAGIYGPIWVNRCWGFMANNTHLESLYFNYRGPDKEALRIGLIGGLLTVLTFGIYGYWFKAEYLRFRTGHTYLGNARGHFTGTGGEMLLLDLKVALIIICTFGFGYAHAECMRRRYYCEHSSLQGAIDFDSLEKILRDPNTMGEGLAGALDVDIGL